MTSSTRARGTRAASSSTRRDTPGRSSLRRVAPHSAHTHGRRASQTLHTNPSPSSPTAAPHTWQRASAWQLAQASSRARPLRFSTQRTRRPSSTWTRSRSTSSGEISPSPGGSSRRSATSTTGQPARSSARPGGVQPVPDRPRRIRRPHLQARDPGAAGEGQGLLRGHGAHDVQRHTGPGAALHQHVAGVPRGGPVVLQRLVEVVEDDGGGQVGDGRPGGRPPPDDRLAAAAGPGPVGGGRQHQAGQTGRPGQVGHHDDGGAERRGQRLHERPSVDGRRHPVHVHGEAGADDRRHGGRRLPDRAVGRRSPEQSGPGTGPAVRRPGRQLHDLRRRPISARSSR